MRATDEAELTSNTNHRRCHALAVRTPAFFSDFLKSQAERIVCLVLGSGLSSSAEEATMQCTLRADRSCRISDWPTWGGAKRVGGGVRLSR